MRLFVRESYMRLRRAQRWPENLHGWNNRLGLFRQLRRLGRNRMAGKRGVDGIGKAIR
jgi:hypothetical protein